MSLSLKCIWYWVSNLGNITVWTNQALENKADVNKLEPTAKLF